MNDDEKITGIIRQWTQLFIHRVISDLSCYGRTHNLSLSQVGVLFQLSHGGISKISQIADSMGITSAAVSQMIDTLVKQGLITRREDLRDRRVKQIELASRGRKVLGDIMRARENWFAMLVKEMNDEEKKAVVRGLKILMEKVSSIDDQLNYCRNKRGI